MNHSLVSSSLPSSVAVKTFHADVSLLICHTCLYAPPQSYLHSLLQSLVLLGFLSHISMNCKSWYPHNLPCLSNLAFQWFLFTSNLSTYSCRWNTWYTVSNFVVFQSNLSSSSLVYLWIPAPYLVETTLYFILFLANRILFYSPFLFLAVCSDSPSK